MVIAGDRFEFVPLFPNLLISEGIRESEIGRKISVITQCTIDQEKTSLIDQINSDF